MNTEHEFCFTIKLKQNNIRDLKRCFTCTGNFLQIFSSYKNARIKKQQQQKKLTKTKNKKYPTTKTKYKKTKIKNQTKQQNIENKKKNKENKETYK